MNDKEIDHLLKVYHKREDLQFSFPEVKYENYQALINWASAVTNQRWNDEDYEILKEHADWYTKHEKKISINERIKNIPQLEILLDVYHKRDNLMNTIKENNLQALINWASAVTNQRWNDEDYEILKEHADWYTKHEKFEGTKKSKFSHVNKVLSLTLSPMKYSLNHINKKTDISDHLPTLYFLTIENNLKNTLELGVREGESTAVLAEAVSNIGGHLWSMDIMNCPNAKKKIKEYGLEKYWTFLQGDDKEIAKTWNQKLDHIFIDTSHLYSDTLAELNAYEKFLQINGFITFHDTLSFPDILKAVKDFLGKTHSKFRFYNYNNSNGFGILRKVS